VFVVSRDRLARLSCLARVQRRVLDGLGRQRLFFNCVFVCRVVSVCTRGLVHEAVPSCVGKRIDAVVALQHTGDCASIQNARDRVGTGWFIRWWLISWFQ
jgi:hypothetical protein